MPRLSSATPRTSEVLKPDATDCQDEFLLDTKQHSLQMPETFQVKVERRSPDLLSPSKPDAIVCQDEFLLATKQQSLQMPETFQIKVERRSPDLISPSNLTLDINSPKNIFSYDPPTPGLGFGASPPQSDPRLEAELIQQGSPTANPLIRQSGDVIKVTLPGPQQSVFYQQTGSMFATPESKNLPNTPQQQQSTETRKRHGSQTVQHTKTKLKIPKEQDCQKK